MKKNIVVYVEIDIDNGFIFFHGYLYDIMNKRSVFNKTSPESYNGETRYIPKGRETRPLAVYPDFVFDGFDKKYEIKKYERIETNMIKVLLPKIINEISNAESPYSGYEFVDIGDIHIYIKTDFSIKLENISFSNILISERNVNNCVALPSKLGDEINYGFITIRKIKTVANKCKVEHFISMIPSKIYYDQESSLHPFLRDLKFLFFYNSTEENWKNNNEYYSILYDDSFSKILDSKGRVKKRITGGHLTGFYTYARLGMPQPEVNTIMDIYSKHREKDYPVKTLNTLNVLNLNAPIVRSLFRSFSDLIFTYGKHNRREYLEFDKETMIVNRVSPVGSVMHIANRVFPEMVNILDLFIAGNLSKLSMTSINITDKFFNNGKLNFALTNAELVYEIEIYLDQDRIKIPIILGETIASRNAFSQVRGKSPEVHIVLQRADRKIILFWFIMRTKDDESYMIWRTASSNFVVFNRYSNLMEEG